MYIYTINMISYVPASRNRRDTLRDYMLRSSLYNALDTRDVEPSCRAESTTLPVVLEAL